MKKITRTYDGCDLDDIERALSSVDTIMSSAFFGKGVLSQLHRITAHLSLTIDPYKRLDEKKVAEEIARDIIVLSSYVRLHEEPNDIDDDRAHEQLKKTLAIVRNNYYRVLAAFQIQNNFEAV